LLFYVMPVVTGESLRGRLERERQLPVADAVRIAREVASALDYAHRHGVVHRDIKPKTSSCRMARRSSPTSASPWRYSRQAENGSPRPGCR
jgi:serine/threonine protein kinase